MPEVSDLLQRSVPVQLLLPLFSQLLPPLFVLLLLLPALWLPALLRLGLVSSTASAGILSIAAAIAPAPVVYLLFFPESSWNWKRMPDS